MKLTSPLNGATYERNDDGTVLVTEKDGKTGVFAANGRHISGELRFADPHMIDWLGMPQAQGMGRLASAASGDAG